MRELSRAAVLLGALAALPACGGAFGTPRAEAPETPLEPGQTRCSIAAGSENPLVTEWPASEKANLEARLREGGVVVAYSGCEMRLLPQCRVGGAYSYSRTTVSTDTVEVRDADELYAKLPLGAARLEGELARSGRIAVHTTVAGQLKLSGQQIANIGGQAEACHGATHVVGALSVGAFRLHSGGTLAASGSVDAPVAGGGVSTSSAETIVRKAGNPDSCTQAESPAPHIDCSSPIQVFLDPLPSALVDRGPPGTIKARFLPASSEDKWQVAVGDRDLCEAPCERWVDPMMPYSVRTGGGFFDRKEVIEVPDLRPYPAGSKVLVRSEGRSFSEFSGGVIATTFGGLGFATGVTLTAIGCSSDKPGMCTAGLITFPLGGALTAGGIWLIVESGAESTVEPVTEMPAAPRDQQSRIRVIGRF